MRKWKNNRLISATINKNWNFNVKNNYANKLQNRIS